MVRGRSNKKGSLSTQRKKKNKKPAATPAAAVHDSFGDFPIVGVGASAGGLEAFTQLLEALPVNTGMAFILVQHLAPTHESLAQEILARTTRMAVQEVTNGMVVRPDQVYIIPPNTEMALLNGALTLFPRTDSRGHNDAIDSFFISLARHQGERAIGVVLAGTGSDGTQGLKAIKAAGGVTLVQDPKSTKYDGMPKKAIAAGVADIILSPKEISAELAGMAAHPYVGDRSKKDLNTEEELQKIFTVLRSRMHVDFTHYKQSTLERRIQRRMMVRRIDNLRDYAAYLHSNPDEAKALFSDVLIHVTDFFRDPEAFKYLREDIFPRLVKNRPPEMPIRIWVAGCATGEEAYSLAIEMLEYLTEAGLSLRFQIFATDIGESAVEKARAGVYSEAIEPLVGARRLKLFFEKVADGYKIKKEIRDLCLFSRHDLTSDPPFSKIDLVSCRNVLIYFSNELQKRVFPVFHYALVPGGFLWLGSSEAPGDAKLFLLEDKSSKVYSKTGIPTPITSIRFPVSTYVPGAGAAFHKVPPRTRDGSDFQKEADRVALARYAPPSVLVSAGLEILQFRGRTAPYLEQGPGLPSSHLLKLIRPELLHTVQQMISLATKKNAPVRRNDLYFEADGKRRGVSIEVLPADKPGEKAQNLLVFFEESKTAPPTEKARSGKSKKTAGQSKGSTRIINQLERDLLLSRQYQQTMADEFGATQDELTAANEELQSANEELQSANEELETAKEELQSTNEELSTVNEEFQVRNADLSTLGNDLNNLLSSVEIPMLIVGNDRRIRRFTPKAEKFFKLISGDVGRPIGDMKSDFEVDLDTMIADVIRSLQPLEKEIKDIHGRWLRLQIRPYKTTDHRIDGAVIALVDIETLKQTIIKGEEAQGHLTSVAESVASASRELATEQRKLEAMFGQAPLGIALMRGPTFIFEKINAAWTELLSPRPCLGKTFMESYPEFRGTGIHESLQEVFRTGITRETREMKIRVEMPGGVFEEHYYDFSYVRVLDGQDRPYGVFCHALQVTDRVLVRHRTEEARAGAEAANHMKDAFLATLSHELRTPLTSILSWAQLIRKQKFDPGKIRHGIEVIEQSAKMQGQLIDDLLDISRIQSGKLSMEFTEVNVNAVVGKSVEAVRPVAESKNVQIETELGEKPDFIWGDAERIQQIVWNLLTNAIKFSHAGSKVRVQVLTESNHLTITVLDQGKGIKAEFLEKLFDRFSQADSSSIRVHGGLGLGLAIVRDLARLQGGTVSAQSEGLGKGSAFSVQFPLIRVTDEVADRKRTPAELKTKEEAEPPDLSGLRVMIVEDEPRSLEVLNEALGAFGATTIPCGTVADALTALAGVKKPDVLISDIAMPGEDGYSLIKKLRQSGSGIPALALTAYAAAQDISRAKAAGFNMHMSKPFDTASLGHAVATLHRDFLKNRS